MLKCDPAMSLNYILFEGFGKRHKLCHNYKNEIQNEATMATKFVISKEIPFKDVIYKVAAFTLIFYFRVEILADHHGAQNDVATLSTLRNERHIIENWGKLCFAN